MVQPPQNSLTVSHKVKSCLRISSSNHISTYLYKWIENTSTQETSIQIFIAVLFNDKIKLNPKKAKMKQINILITIVVITGIKLRLYIHNTKTLKYHAVLQPRDQTASPALQGDSLTLSHQGSTLTGNNPQSI